jgi:myo-inositol-1(or 4)-monophosphatase
VAAGEGAATLSRGPKHEWDVCAGALIVEEAGGRATDMFGRPLRYNQPFPKVPGILAGAPEAYTRALTRLSQTGASDRMDELANRSP